MLGHQIDFVAVKSSPVTYRHRERQPRDLVAQLANHERLEQVTELRKARWVQSH